MDIEATLALAREAMKEIQAQIGAAHGGVITELTDVSGTLAEAFDAIDIWISKGGVLPRDWQRTN